MSRNNNGDDGDDVTEAEGMDVLAEIQRELDQLGYATVLAKYDMNEHGEISAENTAEDVIPVKYLNEDGGLR